MAKQQMHLAFDAGSAAVCGLVGKRLLDAPPQTPTSMLRCTIEFALNICAGKRVQTLCHAYSINAHLEYSERLIALQRGYNAFATWRLRASHSCRGSRKLVTLTTV